MGKFFSFKYSKKKLTIIIVPNGDPIITSSICLYKRSLFRKSPWIATNISNLSVSCLNGSACNGESSLGCRRRAITFSF